MMQRFLYLLLIVLLLPAGCKREEPAQQASSAEAQPAKPVEVASVYTADIQSTVNATALLEGWRDITIAAEIGGTVARIPVEEGVRVAQGELLLELDLTQLDAHVASMQAQLDAARAQLAEVRSATRPQQLAQAEASLAQAEAALDYARKEHERVKQLYEAGVMARSQLDAAEAGLAQAQAAYDAAVEQVSLAKEGARMEQIEAVEAQVRGLEAALIIAQDQRDSAVITAPFAGKIAVIYPSEHEMIAPGTPLLGLVDDSILELTVGVDNEAVVALEVGQPVEVAVEALDGAFTGHVSSIGVKADEVTGAFPVKAAIINEDGRILSGMVGTVTLPLTIHRDVIVVPRSLVLYQHDQARVMVRNGNKAESRLIETGIESGEFVEVVSGLSAGEEIISKGQQGVFDGDLIEVTETQEQQQPAITEEE